QDQALEDELVPPALVLRHPVEELRQTHHAELSVACCRGPMSDSYQTIADVDAAADEAETLAADMVGWLAARGVVAAERTPGPRYVDAVMEANPMLPRTRPNELEVVTGRSVFNALGPDRVA